MCASKHGLSNLTAIVDYNKRQAYGSIYEVQSIEPLEKKWESFGWAVKSIDGHDTDKIREVCARLPFDEKKPSLIVSHTLKGKGSPLLEKEPSWHHKSRISDEVMDELYKGLES